MTRSAPYKKIVLFVTAMLLLLLWIIACWDFLRRTVQRISGDFLYPYLRVARAGFDQLSDQTLLVFSRRELAAQLERLRNENIRLSAQSASAAELQIENARLRALLKLQPEPGWKMICGEVILRDPRRWREQITVDRGSRHGVETGAAALTVSPEGQLQFVGTVSAVSSRTAQITTIFNPAMRMSARLPQSGAAGIIHAGDMPLSGDFLSVGFLPLQRRYTIGEALMTTGFERNIPPGILIGKLNDIESEDTQFSGEIFLGGRFIPAVQMHEIRFVILFVRSSPEQGPRP